MIHRLKLFTKVKHGIMALRLINKHDFYLILNFKNQIIFSLFCIKNIKKDYSKFDQKLFIQIT